MACNAGRVYICNERHAMLGTVFVLLFVALIDSAYPQFTHRHCASDGFEFLSVCDVEFNRLREGREFNAQGAYMTRMSLYSLWQIAILSYR